MHSNISTLTHFEWAGETDSAGTSHHWLGERTRAPRAPIRYHQDCCGNLRLVLCLIFLCHQIRQAEDESSLDPF